MRAALIGLALLGCSARTVAKTEYEVQSESCVKLYDGNPAAQRSCLDYVRNKWTKAGAPPAAQGDAGHE